jgi:hypothetical protein
MSFVTQVWGLVVGIWLGGLTDSRVQPSAVPVSHFGGRARSGQEIRFLQIGETAARVRAFRSGDDRETITELKPPADMRIEPYGLAPVADRELWVLADGGRTLLEFEPTAGKLMDVRPLAEPAVGIWSWGNRIVLSPIPLSEGRNALVEWRQKVLGPIGRLRTEGKGTMSLLFSGMVDCGAGTDSRLACWRSQGTPSVEFISGDGSISSLLVHSFAERRASKGSEKATSAEESLAFPIRDVFPVSAQSVWILANQEGDRNPLSPNPVRGRHVMQYLGGKLARTINLGFEARAILDGAADRLWLLDATGMLRKIPIQ